MLVRRPIFLNGLSAVLDAGQVARFGELACIDTATGNFKAGVSGDTSLLTFGTFTESFTGDGVRRTYVAAFEQLPCWAWLNSDSDPVSMPEHRGSLVYIANGRAVTSSSNGGANAVAGVALDIDPGGRVIVQPQRGLGGAFGGGGGGGPVDATDVSYDDSTSPAYGSTNAQGALDAAKALIAALDGDLTALDGIVDTLNTDLGALQTVVDALPSLDSGTYSPTITIVDPPALAAVVLQAFKYVRVGDVLHVIGSLTVTPSTLAGFNELTLTLPVATSTPATIAGLCNGSSLPRASNDLLLTAGVVVNNSGAAGVHFTLAFGNAPGAFTLGVAFSYVVTP